MQASGHKTLEADDSMVGQSRKLIPGFGPPDLKSAASDIEVVGPTLLRRCSPTGDTKL